MICHEQSEVKHGAEALGLDAQAAAQPQAVGPLGTPALRDESQDEPEEVPHQRQVANLLDPGEGFES